MGARGPWRALRVRGRGVRGATDFEQLGVNLTILDPGEPMAMYHRENDQEDFLVLVGEALAIVEGEERPLRRWDFVHCPAGTEHVIIGAGEGPCVVLSVGARDRSVGPDWGAYTVDETAHAPRRGRRARDDRRARGVCPLLPEPADALSRGLAARLAVGGNGASARRRVLQEC